MENKRIRVAFFLPTLEPGGTERNVVNLVNSIDKQKYQVSLVLGKKEGDFIKEINQDIHITNLDAPYSFGLFFALVHYFKNQKLDIFVSAFPRINIICLVAKIFARSSVKIIITEHSVFSMLGVIAKTPWRRFFARFFMPLLAHYFYPKANAIICVSRGIANDLAKTISSNCAIRVIYNPVIDEKIYQLSQESVNHSWFLNSATPVIVAAGRLVACKDYPTLLKAFALVVKEKSARLVILGRGLEEEKLKQLTHKMHLSESVAFLGFQENPFKYMAKSSVFVLSSLQEGFGNVIIEAMACGTPVVSTDCPVGPEEIITSGENGILVPVGDERAMAGAILEVLKNPVLAQNFSVEGKKWAEFFSVKKSVQEYEKVFKELIC